MNRFSKPFIASLLLRLACADSQFFSRPDLSPPVLNITVPAHSSVESGYLFLAQYLGFDEGSVGPNDPAPYIFQDNGDLVWSGVGYAAGWVADFGTTVIDGKPFLRAFQGRLDAPHGRMYGNHVVLNEHYETVQVVGTASHRLVSCHEFQVVDGNTVLIETPVSVPVDLSAYGGDEDQVWIVSNGFQELDIRTGKLLFEWYSLDHVDPNYSAFPLEKDGLYSARNSADAWNYFHINSVHKDDEGNYLISARNYAAIFKISGTNGEIIWQLGGRHGSDFTGPSSLKFAYQHDARFRYRSPDGSVERISFFDNADHSAPGREINPFSRARFVELNHTAGTATEIWAFPAPDSLKTRSQGNVQFLPNQNVLVNWGQAGAVTEFSKDGEVLFHAYLDSFPQKNVQSYRGFRGNWTGIPTEEPAIVAFNKNEGHVSVHVSWNGDTETKAWRFLLYIGENNQVVKILGTETRQSFETSFEGHVGHHATDAEDVFISAEALDDAGRVLVKTRQVRLKANYPLQRDRSSPRIRVQLDYSVQRPLEL